MAETAPGPGGTASRPLRLGTRGSALALAQTDEVVRRLAAGGAAAEIEAIAIRTSGDVIVDRPLADAGGKGLFTKEIDEALLSGRVDIAVHSMKDMETWLAPGIAIGAVLPREDPRDVLLSRHARRLADLPQAARVGTSSVRRAAQLLASRADLQIVPFRGNVNTRLRKLDEGQADAAVLALAGLRRLGARRDDMAVLDPGEMLPSAAQGAIAVACRAQDKVTLALLAPLDHQESRLCVLAERALLAALDGSCRTPIAAYARLEGPSLVLDALVASPDGRAVFRTSRRGAPTDGVALGEDAGSELRRRAPAGIFAE